VSDKNGVDCYFQSNHSKVKTNPLCALPYRPISTLSLLLPPINYQSIPLCVLPYKDTTSDLVGLSSH